MDNDINYNFNGFIKGYCRKLNIENEDAKIKYSIKGKIKGDIEGNFKGFVNGNTILDDLKTKIYDSLFVLSNIKYSNGDYYIENILEYSRKNIIYIAVYNRDNIPKAKSSLHWNEKAGNGESTKRYNLNKILLLKNFIFKDVHLYSKEQFRMNFIDKIKI